MGTGGLPSSNQPSSMVDVGIWAVAACGSPAGVIAATPAGTRHPQSAHLRTDIRGMKGEAQVPPTVSPEC